MLKKNLLIFLILPLILSCVAREIKLSGGLMGNAYTVESLSNSQEPPLIEANDPGKIKYVYEIEMDREDRIRLNKAYNKSESNKVMRWVSKRSGNTFEVMPFRHYQDKAKKGRICRQAEIAVYEAQSNYLIYLFRATACKEKDQWTIQ